MTDLSGLEVRSLTTSAGALRVSLEPAYPRELGPDDVLVRIEAAPINPSDLGLLFGRADPATFRFENAGNSPIVTGAIPEAHLPSLAARLDTSLTVGNEGAGTVVEAARTPRNGSGAPWPSWRRAPTRTTAWPTLHSASCCGPAPARATVRPPS